MLDALNESQYYKQCVGHSPPITETLSTKILHTYSCYKSCVDVELVACEDPLLLHHPHHALLF